MYVRSSIFNVAYVARAKDTVWCCLCLMNRKKMMKSYDSNDNDGDDVGDNGSNNAAYD